MQTHTDSPFINVTSLGPRSKITATAQTEEGMSFRQVLNAAQGKDAIVSQGNENRPSNGSALRQWLLEKANNDPAEAATLARNYAYNSLNGEGVDLTDYPIIRYCATGEVVTSETTAYFGKTMAWMQKERSFLYESEVIKGSPPAKILEKILDFNDALPKRFRDMANW
ncbi:hypothetical protein [Pseudomonas capsici]|uniref:hypothetical protein n=1 Tax=Pseudomonas capsici TaxID=2810614 RepID=UPI0021F0CE27|nr:hypothetical protein [Pseudomonas capsici]MCV4285977.1 hypothetical protein [Pseudomonas capsici]